MTQLTARRTTLREGRAEDYARIHSRIPEPVASALRESGVLRWNIWRDGQYLFHAIETVNGYPAMVAAMSEWGPIDPDWDALIETLLDSQPTADVVLPLVWSMDEAGQGRET